MCINPNTIKMARDSEDCQEILREIKKVAQQILKDLGGNRAPGSAAMQLDYIIHLCEKALS